MKPLTELNEAVVCTHLPKVASKDHPHAWILIQEPGFAGFGAVFANRIEWPPNTEIDWARVRDLRLFGAGGEWHVWQLWDGTWGRRLYKPGEDEGYDECHYLWGTTVGGAENGWTDYTEDRGATIRLPVPITDQDLLPFRLKVRQIVAQDQKTGLAGVVDAALLGLMTAQSDLVYPKPQEA